MLLAWLYIGSGFIVLEHSTHLVWTRRSSHDAADVIVLWITYSVNIDRQAGPCVVKTYPSIDPVVAPPILLNVIFVFTSVAMTLRSQRSIYGHCLGHGSGTCMLKAARDICYQL